MDLSIITINYNTKSITRNCIDSVSKHTKNIKYEHIIIDNASKERITDELNGKNVVLIKNKTNKGFAGANNQGLKKVRGRYFLLLNSDTIIHDNVLGEMVDWMDKHEDVGASSCALKNVDGSLQGTGGYFPTLLSVFSWMTIQDLPLVDKFIKPFHPMKEKSFGKNDEFYKTEKELDWVTGAFVLGRREIVDSVGLMDEKYFMYVEETDYFYRIKKAGWKVMYLPKWSITHLGGASGGSEIYAHSEFIGLKRFYQKHYPKWQFPLLRLLLKIGALGRMVLFGIIQGRKGVKTYAKAFKVV